MATIPLFPLQIVQFPGVVTPLHIFETRYRKLLKDVIAGDKTFGIVVVMSEATARPLLGSIGCTAKVVIAQDTRGSPDASDNRPALPVVKGTEGQSAIWVVMKPISPPGAPPTTMPKKMLPG